ncbi:hypothetical protein [Ornithobacterium rhinotracheale]|uniref:hypothetical protein n=1 Tax=Ornithobacterium rhinotracheale TaxID=28251 RepID=UPI004036F0AC
MELLLFKTSTRVGQLYIAAKDMERAINGYESKLKKTLDNIELVDIISVLSTKTLFRIFSVELSYADMGTDTTKLKKFVAAENILQVAGAFPGAEKIKEYATEHDFLVVNSVN